ncbi:YdeI/OmpD-associated family protein [Undibacterium sp.]|jgi:uncharacterized protein YdeI (YjbR/CyaY-like superfamily)|uniref:YdeI/OmpD-associated family protein n=1 Tax=Undibacterium sp. TaxID=1914977 RepID=UPI002C33981A|nr:YdeI/OmpD-associated family protein [Undibacterium sp.]HTD03629.1 YdeI/OmpD-associated family protein [Undibacterium sp.]
MPGKTDLVVIPFASAKKWQQWLAKHHAQAEGIWLQIFKKDSGTKTVSYAEALDEALCYGWIDGQKKACDEVSWLQKFSPRRAKSGWSAINVGHAERLIGEGRMQASGLAQVQAAKEDGRLQQAYASQGSASIPQDFLSELNKNKKAAAFFASLSKANLYAIAYRLQTAKKPETRAKRMQAILEMMARGESFHPQKNAPGPTESASQ